MGTRDRSRDHEYSAEDNLRADQAHAALTAEISAEISNVTNGQIRTAADAEHPYDGDAYPLG